MDEKIPFILALIGGILAGMSALTMAGMMLFFRALMPMIPDSDMPDGFPFAFLSAFFGWFFVAGVLGCIATLVGAARLHREPRSREGAIWSIAGGGVRVLSGNMLAAGLAITAGALVLSSSDRV